jgi:Tol biopolymer transport system component
VYWVGAQGGYNVGEIYLVDATGGPPRRIEVGLPFAQSPVWSPDGEQILFVGAPQPSLATVANWDWWICPAEGGQAVNTGVRRLLEQMGITGFRQAGSWPARDRVVFSARLGASINLWELSFSPSTGRVEGAPRRLTTGPGPELYASAGGTGQIVFANQAENLDVWWLPVEVNQGKALGEPQRLTQEAASDHSATVSSDGGKLLFVSDRSGSGDLWTKDLASGKETALTLTPFNESNAVLSRDGTKVVYNRFESERSAIYAISTGVASVPERVCEDCGPVSHCSSEGSRVLYSIRVGDASTPIGVLLLDLPSREMIRLIEHPKHALFVPRFSPDDRWVSFHEFAGVASRRIYVAPLRGTAPVPERDWVPITDGAGLDRDTCWSPDSNLLYFYSERDGFRCIWAQRLQPETKRPVGKMFPVYHLHHARRSIMGIVDLGLARISTAPGKLVFSMGEYTGNIWMGTAQQR